MPMVYGTINENGGIEVNSGQITSAERSDKGRYSVSFQSGTFKATPVVVATVMTTDSKCGESTNRTISVADATPSEACFGIRQANAGDESSDRPFSFVAFG